VKIFSLLNLRRKRFGIERTRTAKIREIQARQTGQSPLDAIASFMGAGSTCGADSPARAERLRNDSTPKRVIGRDGVKGRPLTRAV